MANATTYFGLLKPLSSETFDLNEYNSNLDKIDAGINNPSNTETNLPLGLVAEVDMTSNSGGGTTLYVVTNIASFIFKANRRYRVEFYGAAYLSAAPAANGIGLAHIHTCPTTDSASLTTDLTEIQGVNIVFNGTATAKFYAKRDIKYSSDTTLQIKGTIEPSSAGGTITTTAGTTYPLQLTITDMGKQF